MTCLAVVLDGPRTRNGRRVFDSFVEQNQFSFWNKELVASAQALTYMGFMRPGTLFVSATPEHLQTLKDAWARRILKPAEGYAISSLGDMGAIQQVEQMHFVPLGDVLCDAIAQLNRNGQPATEATIRQFVARHCPHVAPPGVDMVKQTLKSLLVTGLVYRMGEHFFVSVPTNSPPKHKATVECQTGMSIMAPQQEKEKRRGLLARFFPRSVRPAMPAVPQPVSFSPEECLAQLQPTVPALPAKNKFPTCHEGLDKQSRPACEYRRERRRRRDTRPLSSSSECLNYGLIDPPECLPRGRLEVVDDLTRRKKRGPKVMRRRETIARTSTPIGSDSAYSPSPVTDSNEDPASHSDPDQLPNINIIKFQEDHTYMNLAVTQNYDSTQFEDLTATATHASTQASTQSQSSSEFADGTSQATRSDASNLHIVSNI